jgi:hypothetical protein
MRKPTVIAIFVLLAGQLALGAGPTTRPAPSPYEGPAAPTPQNPIDKLVFAKLEKLGIAPANLCSDAAFVRRVYLDAIGTLPTAKEARNFLSDRDPNKRSALIDRLLERDEFADYWAMKWSDLLRIKAEFPIDLWPDAAEGYHRWVWASLKKNKPYDQFVRELLTASGSNFTVPEVNFYRAVQNKDPRGIAQAVALTFMGVRADKWPQERWSGLAGFFAQVGYKATKEWKEEIVYWDAGKAAAGTQPAAAFPDGTPAKLSPDRDPRTDLADWLIAPQNPWFARNVVNRTWSWLLGRGIIHEPDDIRPDNPPSNPELLAYLEKELIASRYDLKHVFRLILNSNTYQLASIPRSKNPESEVQFAHYPLRRLEAEVLIDAVCQITGTTEKYSSAIPEPFTFIPDKQRSITLADGSITSSFLELFGRPARDTGWESERNNRPTAAQRLHLLNSSHIQRKLEQGRKLQDLLQGNRSARDIVTEVYLAILSRFPAAEELKIAEGYFQAAGQKRREALTDLAWALINSAEFLYRH